MTRCVSVVLPVFDTHMLMPGGGSQRCSEHIVGTSALRLTEWIVVIAFLLCSTRRNASSDSSTQNIMYCSGAGTHSSDMDSETLKPGSNYLKPVQ